MEEITKADIHAFIGRWNASGAAERANCQTFLDELCDIIAVERPHPTTDNPHENAYVFDKSLPSASGTTNFIDLYKRNCFVLEAKQGSDKQKTGPPVFSEAALRRKRQRKKGTAVRGTKAWDTAMEKALQQAQTYARSLPHDEINKGRPPFILVVDVGNTIAFYSEFSRSGGNYIPFPDPNSYRLKLDDLHDANMRQRLRQVWIDPMSLDPSRYSAKVTREIASRLAELAKLLEKSTDAETVAQFLMRCIFTMFAEDVGLLPKCSFTQLLDSMRHDPTSFKPMMEHLWATMDEGGFSVILRRQIPKFNGGLFADQTALNLTLPQIELLVESAKADWRDVEPAIFGTLLERALDPVERHKLGAHYTPRAYVERLVKPTIIDPLRDEWKSVQAEAMVHAELGESKKAIAAVEAFHRQLAAYRILDPACGSGNFLYVTLEHLKRLEGEVLNTMQELGEGQMKLEMSGVTVSPQQFFGIEINPRAAAIAELVLWIGYLQWHYRTRGDTPLAEPIIKDFHNIECRDAVLEWDDVEPLLDEDGEPVTRWDGRTTKPNPVTGEIVPDETVRIPAHKYINPHPAEWPDADFIIGNPPFVGNKRMRFVLGDGYVDALRFCLKKNVPNSADYVMYWWQKAAELTRRGRSKIFGLITTNSLTQTFNRKVTQKAICAKPPLSLIFAIPDHPWVDTIDGAAVRIAMTVGQKGSHDGKLVSIIKERKTDDPERLLRFQIQIGKIFADLTVGANISGCSNLKANSNLVTQGVTPLGTGFRLTPKEFTDLGISINALPPVIKPYLIGRDLVQTSQEKYIIDFYGLTDSEARTQHPQIFQIVLDRVKPERDAKVGRSKDADEYAKKWWLFAKTRSRFRPALNDIGKYIGTCRTAKHRIFTFIDSKVIPDAKIIAIALEDTFHLGILSSRIHIIWSLRAGAWLGVGNDSNYNHSECFGKFPFPNPTDSQKERIRQIAKELDNHRKRQQAEHPKLTLTDMYNVLEKVRAFDQQLPGSPKFLGSLAQGASAGALNAKEQTIHQQGLISILKKLHDDLDEAVFAAYGWPYNLTDEEILQHLVDLNAERAAEEANSHIRWLRPAYQAPDEVQPQQETLINFDAAIDSQPASVEKKNWPKALKDRATAVRAVLTTFDGPVEVEKVAGCFNGRRTKKRLAEIGDILEILVALGQIGQENEKYMMG